MPCLAIRLLAFDWCGMEAGDSILPAEIQFENLLCRSRLLLLCPAAFYRLGNAFPALRSKVPLFCRFLWRRNCRGLLGSWCDFILEQCASLLQLSNFLINLCKNFRYSHCPPRQAFMSDELHHVTKSTIEPNIIACPVHPQYATVNSFTNKKCAMLGELGS